MTKHATRPESGGVMDSEDIDENLVFPWWEEPVSRILYYFIMLLLITFITAMCIENNVLSKDDVPPLLVSLLWAGIMTSGSCWLRGHNDD